MHLIHPSRPARRPRTGRDGLPIRLTDTYCRLFPDTGAGAGSGPGAGNDGLDRYMYDMTEPYGVQYRADLVNTADVVSHTHMAAGLLAGLAPRLGPVDLVVLAYAAPDIDMRTRPGCLLVETAPGAPLVFCVSDQGSVAPFTALRLAADYLDECGAHRALVLALDQRTIPWSVPDPDLVPGCNAGVALVVEHADAAGDRSRPPGGVQLWQRTAIGPEDLAEAVHETLAGAARRLGESPVVIAGRSVPVTAQIASVAAHVRRPEPGRVCTAVWQALDDFRLDQLSAPPPVVVVEYDAMWRHLSAAVFQG